MKTCPLFVELCAGTGALSLRLYRRNARPPVSRMGAKTGYADAILRVLGLRPGQGATDRTRILFCEPDAGCRLLLEAYRDRALALAAADIIRSWADEEPRALWERLRAEGPPVCPPADAREVARWLNLEGWTNSGRYMGPDRPSACHPPGWVASITSGGLARRAESLPTLPATIADDARTVDPREVARWARIVTANRLVNPGWDEAAGDWVNTGDGGYCHGGDDFCTPIAALAAGFDAAALLPATITPDARTVDPREVARAIMFQTWSFRQGDEQSGINRRMAYGVTIDGSFRQPYTASKIAKRIDSAPVIASATIADDARPIEPGTLPPGTVAYMDPPYLNTTGYAADLGRAEVVALARRWDAAGAVVCISEAEPIPELVADGWHAVEITGARVGQKRTFSKQQAEWLTLNRPPAWTVPVQTGLFG